MTAMPLDGRPQSKEKKERDGGIAHLGETRRRGRLGDGSVQMRGCEQQQSGATTASHRWRRAPGASPRWSRRRGGRGTHGDSVPVPNVALRRQQRRRHGHHATAMVAVLGSGKNSEQERIEQRKKRDGAAAAVEEKEEGRLGFGEGIGGLGLEEGGRKGGEGAGGGDRWWCGGFGGGQ